MGTNKEIVNSYSQSIKLKHFITMHVCKPPISLYVRPKIEMVVHMKVKAHAYENNMNVLDAYRSLIESVLGVAG